MKKNFSAVLFILHLFIFSANGQNVYNIDSVSHLLLYSYSVYPLRTYDSLYTQRYILKINPFTINESTSRYSRKQLEDDKTKVISIDDLVSVSKEEWESRFLNMEYVLSDNDTTYIQTIEMIRPDVWIKRGYLKGNYGNYMGSFNPWIVTHTSLFYMYMVTLPNGKMYLQGIGNNYIIPLKDGFYVGGADFRNPGFVRDKFDYEKYGFDKELQLSETISSSNVAYAIKPVKNNSGKWVINEPTGNNPIAAVYDSIYKNNYYIIGWHNDKYDVYNALLQPIIMNVDAFNYVARWYIQVVQNNQLLLRSVNGLVNNPIQRFNMEKCGTVPHYNNTIRKNKAGRFVFSEGHSYGDMAYDRNYLVQDIYDNLSFLNRQNVISYTSNDNMDEMITLNFDWLLAKKKNKYGIVQFVTEKGKVVEKQIAPCIYDSITFSAYNEPLILHKSGLLQLCNLSDDAKHIILSPEFISIGLREINFLRYQAVNGKQGWYDIIKGECIEDK